MIWSHSAEISVTRLHSQRGPQIYMSGCRDPTVNHAIIAIFQARNINAGEEIREFRADR